MEKTLIIQRNQDLWDVADDIDSNPLAFYLNTLCLAGMPHEPIDTCNEFTREVRGVDVTYGVANFGKSITIKGKKRDMEMKVEIPYGAPVRVLLCYIIYRIKRFKQKHIRLDSTMRSFLQTIGIKVDYNNGGSIDQYTKALINLCNTYITIVDNRSDPKGTQIQGDNRFIIEKYSLWWDSDFNEGDAYIEISDGFYNYAVEKGYPVEWDVIRKINTNGYRMDLYFWLVTKSFSQTEMHKKYSWGELYATFGLHYPDKNEFKKKMRYELRALEKQVDKLEGRLEFIKEGLILTNKGPLVSRTRQEAIGEEGIRKAKDILK